METKRGSAENTDLTIGQWVARYPITARVFETRGIDYCCGGKRTLEEACVRQGLDVAAIKADLALVLEMLEKAPPLAETNWDQVSLATLLDHIESTHHRFLREEKPRLTALAHKVARVHGERHPELTELAAAVDGIFQALDPHLDHEEQVEFPAFREWEGNGRVTGADLLRSLGNLEEEHTEVGRVLENIRDLASGFEPPPDACNSYRALFQGLERLEEDLHAHIHKENNILHARIMKGSADTAFFSFMLLAGVFLVSFFELRSLDIWAPIGSGSFGN
jgi:regulator of cell morphogenesis and NO signaling